MSFVSITKPSVGDPTKKDDFADKVIDNLNDLNSRIGGITALANASFDNWTSGAPDNWTENKGSGSSSVEDSGTAGGSSYKAISGGNGGYVESSFLPINELEDLSIAWSMRCSGATVGVDVDIRYYTGGQVYISTDTIYSETSGLPTSWTMERRLSTPVSNARYIKLRLNYDTNGATGSVWFDDIVVRTTSFIMAPISDPETGTEYTGSLSYTTVMTHKIYVPESISTMEMIGRVKNSLGGGYSTYLRFAVYDGSSWNYSSEVTSNSTSYTWLSSYPSLDVSAISGFQDLAIQLHHTSGSTSYLKGYAYAWK